MGEQDVRAHTQEEEIRVFLKALLRDGQELALLDLRAGRRGESTYHKLFGTELYSAAALMQATGWRPRVRFEMVAQDMLRAASAQEAGQ